MSLPIGTVTFLFTDMEGSTRLMQELGDRYVQAQIAHHEILRAAFRSGDGRELRTEGDSFFCVFESALDACGAAAEAQRNFASHEWPDGKPIRVRIGLHTGEAPLVGNEYIGLDVHHAARVMACAHGGQVVISEATRSLVESGLGDGLSLRDLGLHRLKDLARPERLFQLVIEGVPDTFPALRTLDSTPNNLPTQLTSFVGREELVAEAKRLLAGTRLLTLVGPGGIGKTRLSLQIAAEVVQSFPDGVYFVALSAVRDPELVASVIAQSIGVPVTGNRAPVDVLLEHLRDKKILLVLDNLEQLLPHGAPLVGRLLQESPHVKAVASSRAALHVYGEQEMAVEPLRLPDLRALPSLAALSQFEAVRLFIERAVAAKHDFVVTNENAPAIAGICERVDGLPLAIELAAARVKLFNPQALLARLETSASVLGTGSRDLPGRQQTLKGAIAWSFDLLDEPQKRLFSRFSVFARGANLEQAEAVCGPASELGVDVLTGLDELAEQSLLRRMPDFDEPRLLMLQVIREYAADRLQETGEAAKIKGRHAAAFLELAEMAAPNLLGPDQKLWLDRLELDHDNFRVAFDWSVVEGDLPRAMCLGAALWRFWQMRGHLREGRMRMEALLAMPETKAHPRELAPALEAAGGIEYWSGDLKAAGRYYDECLELARAGGDKRAIANALYNASFPSNVDRSDTPKAVAMLEEALGIFRELDASSGVAQTVWALAQAKITLENHSEAVELLAEAIRLFRSLGNRFGLGWALFVRALLWLRLDDVASARTDSIESLQLFADADDVTGEILVIDSIAEIVRREGNPIRGARLAGAAQAHEVATGAGLNSIVVLREGWKRKQSALNEDEAAAHAAGQAMTLDQAVAYALEPESAAQASA
ncbi:MAG TPA: adenylate/guanylate cyclase domain-containing protein [Candidatus Dormibacteraeota bacterium]|nr:adenylate/guanylate cyclase domain-containing protein [Candidatus Dormibacteraeota bacterium]